MNEILNALAVIILFIALMKVFIWFRNGVQGVLRATLLPSGDTDEQFKQLIQELDDIWNDRDKGDKGSE